MKLRSEVASHVLYWKRIFSNSDTGRLGSSFNDFILIQAVSGFVFYIIFGVGASEPLHFFVSRLS